MDKVVSTRLAQDELAKLKTLKKKLEAELKLKLNLSQVIRHLIKKG